MLCRAGAQEGQEGQSQKEGRTEEEVNIFL